MKPSEMFPKTLGTIDRALKKLAKRKSLPVLKKISWRRQKIEQEAWLKMNNLEERPK